MQRAIKLIVIRVITFVDIHLSWQIVVMCQISFIYNGFPLDIVSILHIFHTVNSLHRKGHFELKFRVRKPQAVLITREHPVQNIACNVRIVPFIKVDEFNH